MKNKKGFTLVELLIVIGILGVVLIIAIPTFFSIRKNSLEKQYENVKGIIETKAEKYAQDTSIIRVSVGKLIEEGYLSPDDQTDIYNPINNASLNCRIVEINIEDGIYTAVLTDDGSYNEETGTCDDYEIKTVSLIEAACYSETNDQSELAKCENALKNTNNEWYTGSVKLTAKVDGNRQITSYRWSSLTGESSNESSFIVTANNEKVTTYSLHITYSDGTVENGNIVLKIDNNAPTITGIENPNNWTNTDKKISINASDGAGSGIDSYYLGSNSSCPINEFTTTNSKTLDMGTYYACIKDKVGNISSPVEVIVDKIDKIAPTFNNVTGSMTASSIPTANFTDTGGSGLKEVQYYLTSSAGVPAANSTGWKSYSQISYSASCYTTYYLYTKATDNAGNVTVKSEQIGSYYRDCYVPSGGGSSGGSSSGTKNTSSSGSSGSSNTCDWQCQMQKNADAWHNCTTASCKNNLESKNKQIASDQNKNGNCNGCTLGKDGVWRDANNNRVTYKDTGSSSSSSKNNSSSKSTTNKTSSSSSGKTSSGSKASSAVKNTISSIVGKLFGR